MSKIMSKRKIIVLAKILVTFSLDFMYKMNPAKKKKKATVFNPINLSMIPTINRIIGT